MTNSPEVVVDSGGAQQETASERLVSQGATMMRVENEAMLAVSVQRPRDKRKVLREVLDELEIVPALASGNYYVIPYKDQGRTVNVSGPSIKAAMNLMRAWGNCSAKAVMVGDDEESIYLHGIFTDLQTNIRIERPLTVPKFLKRRSGERVRLSDQRLAQAIGSGSSKAIRNAILAGLPDWFVDSYDRKAREIAANEMRQSESKMLEKFLAEGVTREMLEEHIGKPLQQMENQDLADLRGIYNAIHERQVTVEEAFSAPRKSPGEETASVDDVLSGGGTATQGAESDSARGKADSKDGNFALDGESKFCNKSVGNDGEACSRTPGHKGACRA